MITYKQITKSSDIASLSDYYVLDVRTTGPNPSLNAISSVSMLQIEDDLVIRILSAGAGCRQHRADSDRPDGCRGTHRPSVSSGPA